MTVSFSYTSTKIGFVITGAIIALAMTLTVIFGINPNKPSPTEYGGEAYPATLLAMANGCGDIFHIPPKEGQYGVIPDEYWDLNDDPVNNIPVHLMTVPVFGYMANKGLSDDQIRFYTPEEGQEPLNRQMLLRTMYDQDIIVVWYDKELNEVDLNTLKNFVNESDQKILAYPWQYNNGVMVGDRSIAFAKWGTSQTCSLYSDEVLTEFIEFTEQNPINRDTPIPLAPMTKEGTLLPIGGYGS